MYSTCLFCHASLGSNEAIESFPVGRRLAFDAARGRLWVVCRTCERWNLSPLDDRWEAVEECERRFRDTRLRVSTDQIGLARLREGLELVRIGEPQRPEFAAWRYGDQFGRRRRRQWMKVSLGTAVVGTAASAGIAAGAGLFGVAYLGAYLYAALQPDTGQVVARIDTGEGTRTPVLYAELPRIRLLPGYGSVQWRLQISEIDILDGRRALQAARVLLPLMNRRGGSTRQVLDAVSFVEQTGRPDLAFREAARAHSTLMDCPPAIRLALEMTAHEESERRAMEGELARLEQAWREAEEVAAIADRLLVPASVERMIHRLMHKV